MSHTVTYVTSAREQALLADIALDHPGQTWTHACGDPHCTWGCGETWIDNERMTNE